MHMFDQEAKAMKKTIIIKKMEYLGDEDLSGFISSFQIQLLTVLKKRGMLTDQQCDKGFSVLKERNK